MARKVAIVTGVTRGIGIGLFRRLTADGTAVAGIYHRDEEAAARFRREAEAAGAAFFLQKMDVCEFERIPEFVAETCERFGSLDYLVNNVGADLFGAISDVSASDWNLSQNLILNAPFHLMRAALPHMRRQHRGRIVNLGASSKDYMKGAAGLGAFGVHKAALTVLTKTIALEEICNGITVNMVAPGSTEGAGVLSEDARIPVKSIPLGRRVTVEEVVEAILYFLSDNAAGVTGQCLGINGGLST
jgi:NAD(P)-dependent dehydrogenase (short-subunit alcohol dehydrogenase family)